RRHTRSYGDWSSDVCSSDLYVAQMGALTEQIKDTRIELRVAEQTRDSIRKQLEEQTPRGSAAPSKRIATVAVPELDARINEQKRSEERRVGKERRTRSSQER